LSEETVEAVKKVAKVETETELAVLRVLIARQLVMAAILYGLPTCRDEVMLVLLEDLDPSLCLLDNVPGRAGEGIHHHSDEWGKHPFHNRVQRAASAVVGDHVYFGLQEASTVPDLEARAEAIVSELRKWARSPDRSVRGAAEILGLVQR
jgi:hypothetical protein